MLVESPKARAATAKAVLILVMVSFLVTCPRRQQRCVARRRNASVMPASASKRGIKPVDRRAAPSAVGSRRFARVREPFDRRAIARAVASSLHGVQHAGARMTAGIFEERFVGTGNGNLVIES